MPEVYDGRWSAQIVPRTTNSDKFIRTLEKTLNEAGYLRTDLLGGGEDLSDPATWIDPDLNDGRIQSTVEYNRMNDGQFIGQLTVTAERMPYTNYFHSMDWYRRKEAAKGKLSGICDLVEELTPLAATPSLQTR